MRISWGRILIRVVSNCRIQIQIQFLSRVLLLLTLLSEHAPQVLHHWNPPMVGEWCGLGPLLQHGLRRGHGGRQGNCKLFGNAKWSHACNVNKIKGQTINTAVYKSCFTWTKTGVRCDPKFQIRRGFIFGTNIHRENGIDITNYLFIGSTLVDFGLNIYWANWEEWKWTNT